MAYPVKVMNPPQRHGIVNTDGVRMAYGRDSSYENGTAAEERGQTGFKGGDRDLSRTLSGNSAALGPDGPDSKGIA